MRLIQYLVEADENGVPYQNDWIRKAQKADRQRARRATAKRGEENKQKMQAAASTPQKPRGQMVNGKFVPNDQVKPVNTGLDKKPSGAMDTVDFDTGKTIQQPQDHPAGLERRSPSRGPDTVNLQQLSPELIQRAKGNRQDAVEMMTLLGAMYKTLRANPQVDMTPPKIVTQSQNKDDLMALFKMAKGMDLPQLAALSQEIKQVAAAPGTPSTNGTPPAGMQNTSATPNQTSGGKTLLQSLMNKISQAAKSLSPMELMQLRKKVDQAAQNAKPNPSKQQQPIGKPVVTQG